MKLDTFEHDFEKFIKTFNKFQEINQEKGIF